MNSVLFFPLLLIVLSVILLHQECDAGSAVNGYRKRYGQRQSLFGGHQISLKEHNRNKNGIDIQIKFLRWNGDSTNGGTSNGVTSNGSSSNGDGPVNDAVTSSTTGITVPRELTSFTPSTSVVSTMSTGSPCSPFNYTRQYEQLADQGPLTTLEIPVDFPGVLTVKTRQTLTANADISLFTLAQEAQDDFVYSIFVSIKNENEAEIIEMPVLPDNIYYVRLSFRDANAAPTDPVVVDYSFKCAEFPQCANPTNLTIPDGPRYYQSACRITLPSSSDNRTITFTLSSEFALSASRDEYKLLAMGDPFYEVNLPGGANTITYMPTTKAIYVYLGDGSGSNVAWSYSIDGSSNSSSSNDGSLNGGSSNSSSSNSGPTCPSFNDTRQSVTTLEIEILFPGVLTLKTRETVSANVDISLYTSAEEPRDYLSYSVFTSTNSGNAAELIEMPVLPDIYYVELAHVSQSVAPSDPLIIDYSFKCAEFPACSNPTNFNIPGGARYYQSACKITLPPSSDNRTITFSLNSEYALLASRDDYKLLDRESLFYEVNLPDGANAITYMPTTKAIYVYLGDGSTSNVAWSYSIG